MKEVRDASEDIQQLYGAVKFLEAVLSSLQDVQNHRDGELLNLTLLKNPSGSLRQCELELHRLRLELKVLPKGQNGIAKAVRCFTWPFKKAVEKVVVTIERYKSSLILEVGVENL